jgi:large subunit ribosomal protein L21
MTAIEGFSMYAIVATGGKQYKVLEGDFLDLEKLEGEPGTLVALDVVFLSDGSKAIVDADKLALAKVFVEIVNQHKGDKVLVFKFKKRKSYKRLNGHRQELTRVLVKSISATGEAPVLAKPVKKDDEKTVAQKVAEEAVVEAAPKAAPVKKPAAKKTVVAEAAAEAVVETAVEDAPKAAPVKKPAAKKAVAEEAVAEVAAEAAPVKKPAAKKPAAPKPAAEAAEAAEATEKPAKPAAKKPAAKKVDTEDKPAE